MQEIHDPRIMFNTANSKSIAVGKVDLIADTTKE